MVTVMVWTSALSITPTFNGSQHLALVSSMESPALVVY